MIRNDKLKIIVIGIDGATWDIIDIFIKNGKLPLFKKYIKEGAYGILKSTVPPFSLPAWNSAITGVNPGKHAIFDLFNMQITDGSLKMNINESTNRKFPTIFEFLSQYSIKSLVMNVPGTYPPINDENILCISGMLTPSKEVNYFNPPFLKEYLSDYPDFNLDYIDLSYLAKKDKRKLINMINEIDNKKLEIAKNIINDNNIDLFWYVFRSTDEIQHYLYGVSENMNYILNIYENIENNIRLLKEKFKDSILIILSDHGFSPLIKYVHLNTMLKNNNMLKLKNKPSVFRRYMYKMLQRLPLQINRIILKMFMESREAVYDVDLVNSDAICPNYTSQSMILLKNNVDICTKIKFLLDELTDPDTGYKVIENVSFRNELYKCGEADNTLLIEPKKGYIITSLFSLNNEVLAKPTSTLSNKTADHDSDGIFVIHPYNSNEFNGSRSIYDIAPTICHFFKITPPQNLDGKSII